MRDDWATAAEIAAAQIPGLPATKRGVALIAKRAKWKSRERHGRGGGALEFLIDNFAPTPDQLAAWLEYRAKKLPAAASRAVGASSAANGLRDAGATPGAGAGEGAAAGMIVMATPAEVEAAIARFERAGAAAGERAARSARAAAIIKAALGTDPDHVMPAYASAASATGLSISAVRNAWATARRFPEYAWQAALTPGWGTRVRERFVDSVSGLSDFLAALVIERKNLLPTAKVARVALAHFKLEEKHAAAVRRWVQTFREQFRAEILIATHPDRAKSLIMPAHGSTTAGIEDFLEVVELDGTPANALVRATIETRSGRRQLIGIIDLFSRAKVATVARSESGAETGRLLVKFFLTVGLPRLIRTDRGAGFISILIRNFLDRLGIKLEILPPFSSEGKATGEAFMRTLSQFQELERGFIGRDVAQRQKLRGHLSMAARRGKSEEEIFKVDLTDKELEAHLDQFLALEADRPRDELGGLSTNQKIGAWQAAGGIVRRVDDEQALWALLATAGTAAVTKRGIQVGGSVYVARELGAIVGHRVEYREHPSPDRLVIYSADRTPRFVCIATNVEALSDAERRAEAIAARTEFRVHSRSIRSAARKLVRQLGGSSPAELLLSARGHAGATKIISIPFATPALIEAGKGARAAAAVSAAPDPRAAGDASDAAWARYSRLMKAPPGGLSDEDALFLRVYETTAGYRARVAREKAAS